MVWKRIGIVVALFIALAAVAGTAWAYFMPKGDLLGFTLQTAVYDLRVSGMAENPTDESFMDEVPLSFSETLAPNTSVTVPFWVRNISSENMHFNLSGRLLGGSQDWAQIAPHIMMRVYSPENGSYSEWYNLNDWSLTTNLPNNYLEAGAQRKYELEFTIDDTVADNFLPEFQGKSTGEFGMTILGSEN